METTLRLKITGEKMEKLFFKNGDDFYVKFYSVKPKSLETYDRTKEYLFEVIFRHDDTLTKCELLERVKKYIS